MSKRTLPNSYEEMTVQEWRSFCFIQPSEFEDIEKYEEDVMDAFFSQFGYDYDEMEIEDLIKFGWIFKKIPNKEIPTEAGGIKFINYRDLTLADFIDLESQYQKGTKGQINCLAVLLRKTMVNKWGVTVVEKRKYRFADRYDKIDEMKVSEFISKVHEVGKYIKEMIEKYSAIFEKSHDDDEPEEIEGETHNEKMHKAFKWQKFVFFASDFDHTKQEKILKMNVNFLFNTLAMQKILKIYPK